MTALAGFWSLDGRFDPTARCRPMIEAQARYGTSESAGGIAGLALAARLHPFLPEDRHDAQPLIGGDGRFALVADLRLDNRADLAAALGLDPGELSLMADSALLLLALERWGESALDRILGDFAFAFYDARERRLLLARDPLGQRPLFWHRGDGFVAFSSMPCGIHALGTVARRPDETSLIRYLAGLPRSGPESFFEGVERVEPGHAVTVTPERRAARRYWRPRRRELRLKRFEDYVEAFRSELDSAVARRLRGAGDLVAAHLSAGWDSGATAATAARLLAPAGGRVLAFTHVPSAAAGPVMPFNRFADEGALAAATARLHPNVEHVRLASSGRSPLADLDRYAALFERPVFNLCNHVWLSQIRAAAGAAGARILLSGEIGNWTISAAPNTLLADFLRQGRWLAWSREARFMIRDGRARLRGVAASSFGPWIPGALWSRLERYSSGPHSSVTDPLHPRLRDSVAGQRDDGRSKSYFDQAADALMAMDWGEHRKGILAGWGIDKRDPTADIRLIDFCLSLPLDMLMKDGVRRPLARAALADRVAPAVLAEKRKGYQSADWHVGLSRDRAGVARLVEAMAADETASRLIDVERLRALVREWPDSGWEDPGVMGAYRIGLLKGLTAGHFILAAGR
ncbi:MAG TPA: asparagine synthase-related protein [Allosphingosinicella sp.]|nr:asparagine synthase-related protein [Allosphingosinicella sp.]